MAGCKTWQGKLTWSFPVWKGCHAGREERGLLWRERESLCERASKNKTSPIPGEQSTMLSVQQEEDNRLTPVTSIYALPRKSRTMRSMQSDPFLKTGYCISDAWSKQGHSENLTHRTLRWSCTQKKRKKENVSQSQTFSSAPAWLTSRGMSSIYFSNVAQMRTIPPDGVNGVLFPSLSSWQVCRLIWTFKTPVSFHMSEHCRAARASEAITTSNVVHVCVCVRVCVNVSLVAPRPQCCVSRFFLVSLGGQQAAREGLRD